MSLAVVVVMAFVAPVVAVRFLVTEAAVPVAVAVAVAQVVVVKVLAA